MEKMASCLFWTLDIHKFLGCAMAFTVLMMNILNVAMAFSFFWWQHVSTNSSSRDKSANVAVPKQDEQPISDKSNASGSASGAEISEDNSGINP